MSIEKEILVDLHNKLASLPWVKLVEHERIRIGASDFQEHEIPAIQIYDSGAPVIHAGNGRIEVSWQLAIEIILKSTVEGVVNQGELLDKKEEVERIIGANVDLGIRGMKHFKYVSWITDIHSIQPFYLARLNFEALFLKAYTGCAP